MILAATPITAAPFEDQVVRLLVSKREGDESSPWQYEDSVQQTHLGVVMKDQEILTTAYAVAHATSIEIQRFGETTQYEAEVSFVDYEINLATLKPKSPIKGLSPATFGDELQMDDSVDIYRPRDTDQLVRIPGNLQDTVVVNGVTSSYGALTYQIKTQQSGLGWSEPIFKNGKLVAIATGQDNQFVHAIPTTLINHMLKDNRHGHYRGFPTTGLALHPLVSPDMRRYLGITVPGRGVRVADITPDSPFRDILKVDDVILAIDDIPVTDQGFIDHRLWGKIPLKYIINQHFAGDKIRIKAMRSGRTFDVTGSMIRYDSSRNPIIQERHESQIPHVIFGGLIFQELSINFLKQWGKDWTDTAPIHLLFLYEYRNKPTKDPKERMVFISRVLADPINRGYSDIGRVLVSTINGQTIHSMDDVKKALATPTLVRGVRYARIELKNGNGEIILPYDGLDSAHKRIAKTYEIPEKGSFFDPPMSEKSF